MSGMIPPINAHSSVEIDNSCNECCGCWPRRVKKDFRKPVRGTLEPNMSTTSLKVHSATQPTLTQSAEDEWEITIDGKPVDPVADSIKKEHGVK